MAMTKSVPQCYSTVPSSRKPTGQQVIVDITTVHCHFLRACSCNRFNRVSAIATSSSSATPDMRISRRSNVLQPAATIDSPLVTSRQTRPDLPQLRAQIGAASDENKRVVDQDKMPWCNTLTMVKQGAFVLARRNCRKSVYIHVVCQSLPQCSTPFYHQGITRQVYLPQSIIALQYAAQCFSCLHARQAHTMEQSLLQSTVMTVQS